MERLHETLLLSFAPGIGPAAVNALLEALPEPGSLLDATVSDLRAVGASDRLAEAVRSARGNDAYRRELDRCHACGVRLVTPMSDDFPTLLRHIDPVPPVLWVRGRIEAMSGTMISIVGARRCSPYGRRLATDLAADLARAGVTVASGMARGVDTAAHLGALEARAPTIAVLGCGVDVIYPRQNRELARRIFESGCLVSEFPLGAAPLRYHFPRRNRIISGLARGVVVVEATHKSGSLITADWALDQGRDVFAVPGHVGAELTRGTHKLLREGAKLVETAGDILEETHGPDIMNDSARHHAPYPENSSAGNVNAPCSPAVVTDREGTTESPGATATETAVELGPRETRILSLMSADGTHIDELIDRSGYPAAVVSALLTLLEMKGRTRQLPGKWFVQARSRLD